MLGNGPQVLGNGPYVLGNGPYVLGNGPQVLGNDNGPPVLGNGPHVLGIMSQFGIMSHSALCRIRGYFVWHYVAFGVMSFSIMSHLALFCIQPYVVRLCVVRHIVAKPKLFDVMSFGLLSVYLLEVCIGQ